MWRTWVQACTKTHIHTCAFTEEVQFLFTLPALLLLLQFHLLPSPQRATPWSEALTVLAVLWCELLRGCDSHVCLVECVTMLFKCVFVRGCSCCGWLLWARISACPCVWVCAHIQYVCLPGHGLRSNKKAQERQAAGFQFGAVSCWMLCNEQKRQILVVCPFTPQVQLYCRKTVVFFFF